MIKQQQHPQPSNPPSRVSSGSIETPAIITRKRSSSKTQSNYNPTSSHEQQQLTLRSSDLNSTFQQQVTPLDRLVWVLKIKSLNGTFDSKTLIVPQIPETLKLGRPGGSKVQSKSTNGFFDSRVLSRNHAELFIDPDKSSLFIRDLKSSNGTYINGKLIEPFKNYELKVNDKFDLGSNLENQTAHKKISCEVTDFLIMDLKAYNESVYKLDQEKHVNEKEFFNNAIDALIYGDVVNDMYEDNLLNILASNSYENKKLENNFSISGLYPSSNIKNTSKLEDTTSQLLITINNEFIQNEKLNKIHKFLVNYNENLDQFEEFLQNKHKKVNGALQENLDDYLTMMDEANMKIKSISDKNENLLKEIMLRKENEKNMEKLLESFKQDMNNKDQEISEYRKQLEQLKLSYDELSKEKELIINFDNVQSKETKRELATNGEQLELKLNNGHQIENGSFNEEEPEDESETGDDGEDNGDSELIMDSDNKVSDEKEVSNLITNTRTSQLFKPNLVQATIVLLASLLVGGVTFYQKN